MQFEVPLVTGPALDTMAIFMSLFGVDILGSFDSFTSGRC